MNQKVCQLNNTFINLYTRILVIINLYTRMTNFYLIRFAGNKATLYSYQGRIFVPKCVDIKEIDVETTEKCCIEFPFKIIINNSTINAFYHEKYT